MSQVQLTSEQLKSISQIPVPASDKITLTRVFGFNEHVRVVLANGTDITCEYRVYPDGRTEDS